MSVRRIFAENLRRLILTRKSQAQVARDLGINRQQFNSYLTGKNLPNESIIDKVCLYFDVAVGDMFKEIEGDFEFKNLDTITHRNKQFLDRFFRQERRSRQANIASGLYYIYFEIPTDPEVVTCSLLAVDRKGALTTFRRITRLRDGFSSQPLRGIGASSGIILNRAGTLFFIGCDTVTDWTPSLLVAVMQPSSSILFTGNAQVKYGSVFQTLKFCIVAAPKLKSIWSIMRNIRMKTIEDLATKNKKVYEFFIK